MQLKPILLWKACAAYGRERELKNADITSDDQLGGQGSCQALEDRVWIKQLPLKRPALCAACLLSFFVCLIIHSLLSHLLKFLMHGVELELVRGQSPKFREIKMDFSQSNSTCG